MEHYFIPSTHSENEYFKWNYNFNNINYTFNTVSGVFNYRGVDKGTQSLLNYLQSYGDIFGNVLDMGCGLGVIGVVLKKQYPNIDISFSDVNSVAVDLCKKNVNENKIVAKNIVCGNLYDNITDTFDYIVSNPPIRAGKQVLLAFCDGAKSKLNLGGKLIVVIRKDLGALSLKEHLSEVFSNCIIAQRDKGYYILISEKK